MNTNQYIFPTSIYIVVGLLINLSPIYAFVEIHGLRPFIYFLSLLYFAFIAWRYIIIRKILLNKLVLTYICLICYHTANCYLQGVKLDSNSGYFPFFLIFYSNLVILVVVCALYYQNPSKSLKFLIVFYISYIFLALVSPGFLESRGTFERAITIHIHPNQLSQCASMSLFIILLYRIIKKKTYVWTAVVCALPLLCIFISGSRNGFFQLLVVVFTFIVGAMVSKRKKDISLKFFLGGIVAILAFFYIRENSMMGERLKETDEIASNYMYVKTGTPLDLLKDRQIYYLMGFENFLEHPIFGIGLRAFSSYNKFDHPLHSEYMIHLTEGGFVAASAYLLFIFILGRRLLFIYLARKDGYSITMLMTFICYLMVGLAARECYYAFFFPILSVLIAYTERENKRTRLRKINKLSKNIMY